MKFPHSFNAWIAPDGKIHVFSGKTHQEMARSELKSSAKAMLNDGFVRVSWGMLGPIRVVETQDLKRDLAQIQKGLFQLYEQGGSTTVFVEDRNSSDTFSVALGLLVMGSISEIRRGIEGNPPDVPDEVELEAVIEHLLETDGTGDPEWQEYLVEEASKYRSWRRGPVLLKEIENGNTSLKSELREYLNMGDSEWKEIVLVPSKNKKYKWYVIDGGHRAAALSRLTKEKYIGAYYPEMSK